MNNIKIRKVFLSMLLAVFAVASVCGAAFAAVGDVVGLIDLPTYDGQRWNTFDANLNDIAMYTLEIYPMVDSGTVSPDIGWFTSAADADPSNFRWEPNTTVFGNVDFYFDGAAAVDAGGGHWYYSLPVYVVGNELGPESWRATYAPNIDVASGDFSFVATDTDNPDTGLVNAIRIEFQDGPPLSAAFASGDLSEVDGFDDRVWTSPGVPSANGRSYATALDAVARSTQYPNIIIGAYAKPFGKQILQVVSDDQGVRHPSVISQTEGFMYGIYKPDPYIANQYNYDPESYFFNSDDYVLKEYDYILWAIGEFEDYDEYFPASIIRP
jgi:hypothetical protein